MNAIKIIHAAVFDGEKMAIRDSVTFSDGIIVENAEGAAEVDARGCTVLPALIDSHVHLYGADNLKEAAKYGIGTMLDMAVRSPQIVDPLRNRDGLPRVLSCCLPAFARGSALPVTMNYPDSSRVADAADAVRFVDEQTACGADYIKVILEEPKIPGQTAFDPEVLAALVTQAHTKGKKVIAHAVSPSNFVTAADAEVDVITHIPFFKPLSREIISLLARKRITLVPTMGVMKGIVKKAKRRNPFLPFHYKYVKKSVEALRAAGVLMLAGTDANMNDPTTPCEMPYGASLHDELTLMVEAGFSAEEALRSATSLPARCWGLRGQGMIEAGYKADLLLVEGNPARNIKALRNIKRVWLGGREV